MRSGWSVKTGTRIGQAHPFSGAVEHGKTEPFFKLGQLFAQCRLRQAEHVRRTGEVSNLGNMGDQPQMLNFQVQHETVPLHQTVFLCTRC